MDIVSKFMVASEQGVGDLLSLKKTKYKNMYENIVTPDQLSEYIDEQLNHGNAVKELNNFNNQLIILYVKNIAAGLALVRRTPVFPEALKDKRTLNYSFFYILPEYDTLEARMSLWEKSLSVSKMSDAVWIEVLQNDPLISFFENCGFNIQEKSSMSPFAQPSYIMIRYKNNN